MTGTKPEDSAMMEDMAWWLYKLENIKQNQPDEIKEVHQTATKRGVSEMSRFIYCIYIILFLFIPVFSASGNIKTVDVSPVIQVKDNLLTVKARGIPLKKVLIEIAKQKNIKIKFYASVEDSLITNFSSLPMEKGLAKLLRNYNYTLIKGEEHEIKKVVILSNTGGSQHRGMEPVIAYTEEPPLYENPYDEDLNYQEGEDVYDELSGYNEEEVTYVVDMDHLERARLGILEGADVYAENSDISEKDMVVLDKEIEFDILDILSEELQDEEIEVRLGAVEILGVIGGDRAIKALEDALTDESELVRIIAIEELRRLKEEE